MLIDLMSFIFYLPVEKVGLVAFLWLSVIVRVRNIVLTILMKAIAMPIEDFIKIALIFA
jgi:hypothetical protein